MTATRRRWALVTGAASGIGRATATRLAAEGWSVGLADRDAAVVEDLATRLGPTALALPVDVTDAEAVRRAIALLAARSDGRLDLLVNSAGVLASGNFEGQALEAIGSMLAVNTGGPAILCHAAFPLLAATARASGRAAVVNISSASSLAGIPSLAVYSATKAWVRGFTEALAIEWARHGIAVRAVAPPFVDTPMARIDCRDNPFFATMGAALTADAVAAAVIAAATGGPVHRLLTVKLKAAALLARLLPASWLALGLALVGRYPRRAVPRGAAERT